MLPFNVASIQSQLTAFKSAIATYTRDTYPMFFSNKYIAPNSVFFRVGGRQNYFPPECGTSEAATVLAVAFWRCFEATNDNSWKTLAIAVTDAYANYFFLDNLFTADVSQGINSDYKRNHWLVVAFGSVISEGLQTGNDPFNYGYFTAFTFTNGIAQLNNDLSRVFKVYSGGLYYKNLFAPVVNGVDYTIDYWVSVDGFKTYPDGRKESTNEPIGRVRLTTNFNGSLQVAYTRANSAAIASPTTPLQGQGMIEPYPCWFPCIGSGITYTSCAFDANWWAWEAFNLAHKHTGETKYFNAKEITKFNSLRYLNLQKETIFYRRENSSEPLRTPGSFLIQTNTSQAGTQQTLAGYTATRETVNPRAGMLRLNVNAIATPVATSYPTMELQNYANQVFFDALVSILIQLEISQAANLKLKLSLSPDANDFTQEYTAFFPVPANTLVNKSFNHRQFTRADSGTVWHPFSAENPVFVFNGATWTIQEATISNTTRTVVAIAIPNTTAGAGFINANYSTQIPEILYSSTGLLTLRIKDNSNNFYNLDLSNTAGNWLKLQTSWQEAFGVSNRQITEIVFLGNNGTNPSTIAIAYAGMEPKSLPIPCTIYKASISCELKTAYTFWIGDFKPSNNILDKLKYTPGAAPFIINTLNNSISGYQGVQFFMAYQSAHYEYIWGFVDGARNVVKMIDDSQEAYTNQSISRLSGPIQQVFLPYSIENIPFLDKATVDQRVAAFPIPFIVTSTTTRETDSYVFNVFSWEGLDPNTRWAAYCFRTMEDLARYYLTNRNDLIAKKVLSKFIRFIYDFHQTNGTAPITDFPPAVNPQQNYAEPHKWALLGCMAIATYKARIERVKSWWIIKTAYEYITNQFISTGPMAGFWAKDQPDSVISGTTYKQFFSFWAGKIAEFLAECLIYQTSLELDESDTNLIFPDISCNAVSDYHSGHTFDFPLVEHQFADGSTQQVLLSRSPRNDTIELRFEALNSTRLGQLVSFYDTVKGKNIPFTFNILPSISNYEELEGIWIFSEKPNIEQILQNPEYGLYNVTIKVKRCMAIN